MTPINWKTKVYYVDEDTGEIISEEEIHNFIITKTESNAYIQHGHGTREFKHFCKRVYNSDLFSNTNQ